MVKQISNENSIILKWRPIFFPEVRRITVIFNVMFGFALKKKQTKHKNQSHNTENSKEG